MYVYIYVFHNSYIRIGYIYIFFIYIPLQCVYIYIIIFMCMYLYTYTKYFPFLFPYHQSYSLDRIFADRACYPDDFCVARSTPQACGTSYVLHGCNIPKACHLYIPSLFETNISEIHVCRH